MTDKNRYSVLVVEDEILQRESIRKKIDAFSDQFKVVFEAENGSEALDYITHNIVDVVVIDIVMPIMDGLEFLKEASMIQPGCYYVILSGHSEFQYAQKAMQFGAKEYMLKPVQDKDLFNVLNKVLSFKSQNIGTEAEVIKALLSTKMSKDITDKYHTNSYRLALVHLGNMTLNYRYIQELEDIYDCLWNDVNLKACAMHTAEKYGIPEPMILANENPDESIIFYRNSDITDDDFAAFLSCLCDEINCINKMPYATILFNASELRADMLYKTCRSLRKTYYEVCQPWRKQLIVLSDNGMTNDFNNMNVSAVFVMHAVQAFHNRNANLAKTTLYETLDMWRNNNLSLQQFYQNMQYFLKTLRNNFTDNDNWDALNKNVVLYFTISASFDEFFENFFDVLMEFCNMEKLCDSMDDILLDVKAYIEEHFKEQINVNDLAEKFNISPSHLSRKFKELYGQSPINYLINIRINEACRLIYSFPDMEMKYIGELTGYTDYFYFSKLFKKYKDCSPSKYKKAVLPNA